MEIDKWKKAASLIPALAMAFIDQSVLPVALPAIQRELEANYTELQWAINSYLLAMAVFLLPGGKLGDYIGQRKAFIIGMILFALSSILCGMSFSIFWLIASRALQGVGAALMIPASNVLLMSFFPPNKRGKAVGINVSIGSLFLIAGPLIGGYLTEFFSWRWVFWINLPLSALGIFLTLCFVSPVTGKEGKFDGRGFFYFAVFTSLLILGIMQVGTWGGGSLKTLCCFAFSLISGIALLWHEKKAQHPFLEFKLFRHPVYKAVNISVFSAQFILMITVYRAVFFQDTLDWSPMKTGLVTMSSSLPVLFMSPIGGWLSDRIGPKIPVGIGFVCLIFSFFWTAFFVKYSLGILFIGLLVFGIGVPLVLTPSYSSAMNSIPPKKAGIAFGTIASFRSLASASGVAIFASGVEKIQSKFLEAIMNANEGTRSLNFPLLEDVVSGKSSALDYLSSLPQEKAQIATQFIRESQLNTFFTIHLIVGVFLIISFYFVSFFYHKKSSHHPPESFAEGWD